MPLKEAYPKLLSIAQDRDVYAAGLMSRGNGMLHWDLTFTRSVHYWEQESISSFLDLIYSAPVKGMGADTLCWGTTAKEGFTVKRYYSCLRSYPSRPFHGSVFGRRRCLLV